MCNPHKILLSVLQDHKDSSKWNDAKFERIKRISNSKVGDVGQDFIERFCKCVGFSVNFPGTEDKRSKQSPWDIEIEGIKFELKTATEDINGAFQFNHVRYHRKYDALICLGISPVAIHFGCWSKADVTTGKAGHLASMEKDGNASYKLTKKPEALWEISEFETRIMELVTNPTI